MELKVIAHAKNPFMGKFGIPRQSLTYSRIETRIVFTPLYSAREALRGIEAFSHLWIIWGFHANQPTDNHPTSENEWSPTVRPPRLGGNRRMGVFATRSPFRPNPIGLSSVRLIRVEETPKEGLVLVVKGADMMNGTPIYDIKPYLTFSDSHPDAVAGFAENTKDYSLSVDWNSLSPNACPISPALKQEIDEILSQDPRPAYQNDPERVYRMDYAGHTIAFSAEKEKIVVRDITQLHLLE